jgi:hypothetical protein
MPVDPILLSRELISFNTINPPGNKQSCMLHLERILTAAGLETSLQQFAPEQCVTACWRGSAVIHHRIDPQPSHLETV